ncbi:MAG: 30S ribosomal protein S21 [bacterium]|nr:30S ribosomal protein S21 [bacterium]
MEVKRKPRESTSFLLRRFTQKVRESGILVQAKKNRFHIKKQSRLQRRKGALERVAKRKIKVRLKKLGKIK